MKPITTFFALLADNPDGTEGLCMIFGHPRPGDTFPLVGTDVDNTAVGGGPLDMRLNALRQQARALAKQGNRNVRLVRFTARQDMEVFHPDGRREDVV